MSEFQKVDKNEEKKQTAPEAGTVRRELSDVNGPQGGMLPDSVSQRIQSKRGSGTRLTPEQNKKYSGEFGRDMSDVRIHNDPESNALSQALNARAFTIGADVFLSKGIDPGSNQRDQKTLKHELTHVVQQNGQAGSGSLRLGAAHTAQEHEAEASAEDRGGVNTSAADTVQRNIFTDVITNFGSGIGHMLLKQFGLEEAFNEFNDGNKKVKAVEDQMKEADDQTDWNKYNDLKKEYEKSAKELDTAENTYKTEKKKYEKAQNDQIKAQKAAAKTGGNAPAIIVNADDVNQAKEVYESKYDSHEKIRTDRLALLQKYDETITQDDLEKRKIGKTRMVFSVLATAAMTGLLTIGHRVDYEPGESNMIINQKIKAAQAVERKKVSKWFATIKTSDRKKLATKNYKTVSMDRITDKKDAREIKGPEEQYKDLIWSVYEDIKDEDSLKNVIIDKEALWTKIQTSPEWTNAGGLKSAFNDVMATRLDEGTKERAGVAQFLDSHVKKTDAEAALAAEPGFEKAAGLKKAKEDAEAAANDAQNKLTAFDRITAAEGEGTVEVTVGAETRNLNRGSAQQAVTDADDQKRVAEAALTRVNADPASTAAQKDDAKNDKENADAACDKANAFKEELERLITEWTTLIGGKSREELQTALDTATAARERAEREYTADEEAVYNAAFGRNANLPNYVADATNDKSIKFHARIMESNRTEVHALIRPENIVKMLSPRQVNLLKGLIRGTVLSTVRTMKDEQTAANNTFKNNQEANFAQDKNVIAEGIYNNTKEKAKTLSFYKDHENHNLSEEALHTKMLAGIKKSPEMASFWETAKSASSGTDNTAMDHENLAQFINQGTEAYFAVLRNIREGDSAEGGSKYPKGTGNELFNSITKKAYALLPQDLKTYFVGAENDRFKELFGADPLAAYKGNIVAMGDEGVPIEADKEAAELSEKIITQEDSKNKSAKETEENKLLKQGQKSREFADIIKGTFALVQKEPALRDSYKSWLRFLNMVKKEFKDLIYDGLEQSMSKTDIAEAIVETLKEKQEKTKS